MSVAEASQTPSDEHRRGVLVERDAELGTLLKLLERARAGASSTVVVDGPAGIGKTALLEVLAAEGRDRSMTVLTARATPLERHFSYAVTRQLFDPVRAERRDEGWHALLEGPAALALPALELERSPDSGDPGGDVAASTLHGLYWLTANLAQQAPALILLDDAHWADPPSVRWLAHLVPRLDGLPVMLAISVRGGDTATDPGSLREIATGADPVMRLGVLGAASTYRLVEGALGPEPDPGFCEACHSATGGNPLLLRALIGSLASEGVTPTAGAARRIARFRPDGVAQAVERTMATLPEGSDALAEAVAILGDSAELRHVSDLAGVDRASAAGLADALSGAEILEASRPLRFVHPLVRATIYESLPPGRRAVAHTRAAALLGEAGAGPEQLAVHLLETEPDGDPAVVRALSSAARKATARGAPDVAVTYLHRALAEPPPPEQAPAIELDLGLAEVAALDPGGSKRLLGALKKMGDSPARPAAALRAANTLGNSTLGQDAVAACQLGLSGTHPLDRQLGIALGAVLITNSWYHPKTVALGAEWLRGLDAADAEAGPILICRAVETARRGEGVDEARALLDRAISMEAHRGASSQLLVMSALLATWTDDYERAAQMWQELIDLARTLGALNDARGSFTWRSLTHTLRGDLAEAKEDLASGLELEWNGSSSQPYGLAHTVHVSLLSGELDVAERELAAVNVDHMLGPDPGGAWLMEALGLLDRTRGDLSSAARKLRDAGRRFDALEITGPALTGWRGDLALALAGLGQTDEAAAVAADNLQRAERWGGSRPLGVALRVSGMVQGGEEGMALLRRSADTLEHSSAALEHATSLTELGSALRRANRRAEARGLLRAALDAAHRCGAAPLVERAREELVATGARPRRPVLSGADSLTPRERKVAKLAAEGRSNREIAQELFVTERTVETHVRHALQKLEVSSRREIGKALDEPRAT